jgi:Transglutaminase-like superfamily/Coenzyme PQQ synthesis protein D (PqqD)
MSNLVQFRYAVSRSVRHVEIEGLRVILDIGTEAYIILDDAASAIWSVLIGERDPAAAYSAVSSNFDVDEDRWLADIDAFGQKCLQQGLLVPVDAAPPPVSEHVAPPIRLSRPAMVGALACLLGTRRALSRYGFRTAYESYAQIAVRPETKPLASALRAFTRAENLFIAGRAPGDCLLRSLSLYRFLRLLGCRAEHVIGVRRFPFKAHAWVECDGSPLLDGRAQEFTSIARIGIPHAAPA